MTTPIQLDGALGAAMTHLDDASERLGRLPRLTDEIQAVRDSVAKAREAINRASAYNAAMNPDINLPESAK